MDGGVVADVGAADVKGADINAGVDGVMVMQTTRRVAANDIVHNESPFSLTVFLLPNPSVNEDFTLLPTAEAVFTAVHSRLSASD